MKDGENESYHEWLARTSAPPSPPPPPPEKFRHRQGSTLGADIAAGTITLLVLFVVILLMASQCQRPNQRPPEPMPGITSPLPPCLDDTDHI